MRTARLGLVALWLAACGGGGAGDSGDRQGYELTLISGAHGSLSAYPAGPRYPADILVTLTATPELGYRMGAWSGTANDTSTGTKNSVTMDADKTVSVSFAPITSQIFTLTLNPGPGGTLTADPPGPSYADNTLVTLTAIADPGFQLQAWSGTDDDARMDTTNTLTLHADTTVGATFVSVATGFTLTLVTAPTRSGNATWGSIHAIPPDAEYNLTNPLAPEVATVLYPEGTVVTLTARQTSKHWPFARWIMPDGSTPTACTVEVTMDADKQVTATFPQDTGAAPGCP